MRNVTISMDEDLHRRVRIEAAKAGKSVSKLIADLLEAHVESSAVSVPATREAQIAALERILSGPKWSIMREDRMPSADSAMNARMFIDTNVFLYAIEEHGAEKTVQASTWLQYLLRSGNGVANLQVLNEITNVLIKHARMASETVFDVVDSFAAFGTAPLSPDTVAAARLLHFKGGHSWWDCLLLAVATFSQRTCRMGGRSAA